MVLSFPRRAQKILKKSDNFREPSETEAYDFPSANSEQVSHTNKFLSSSSLILFAKTANLKYKVNLRPQYLPQKLVLYRLRGEKLPNKIHFSCFSFLSRL